MADVKEDWDEKLSYSSFNQYHQCPRKYYLRKVAKVKVDSDSNADDFNLRFGKAFHQLLEDVSHQVELLSMKAISKVCDEYELEEDDKALLIAMVRNYRRVREKTTLLAHTCELEVNTPFFTGHIDMVLKEKDGPEWWMGDLKTAASYNMFLNAKLPLDWQLNLYAHHAPEVAALLGLELEHFKGCRYVVATKSKIKRKKAESFKNYMLRLDGAVSCYEIPIRVEEMKPSEVYADFLKAHVEIKSLYKSSAKRAKAQASPNFGSCTDFWKPCEYWSQCHGKEYSELCERNIITSENDDG